MTDARFVILAGGQGTRFWPESRKKFPKQFLCIEEESLIQATASRVAPLSGEPPLVVTNKLHIDLVRQHLPAAKILGEPVARNTAAAVGLAAVAIARENPEAIMVLLPADHVIAKHELFRAILTEGIAYAASHDDLVTIGVTPTFAHTGFGYIQCDDRLSGRVHRTRSFEEKPSRELAESYLNAGTYFWNSGMFIWKARVILDAIRSHEPELYKGLMHLRDGMDAGKGQDCIDEIFPDLPAAPIDIAVMEKAKNRATIVAEDFGWSDVGSWDVWASFLAEDARGNIAVGDTLLIDSANNIVKSKGRCIALVGMENTVVVETEDAILVCPRDRVQDVKKVVEELKDQGRESLL